MLIGSTNIEIRKPRYVYDNIALLDENGQYLLNGHNFVSWKPITTQYAGVTLEYSGTKATVEKVITSFGKKIRKDLTVQVSTSSYSKHEEYVNFAVHKE